MTEAYPLYWPEHRPRTPAHKRQRSRFATGFGQALQVVGWEIERLGGTARVISTDVPRRRDGLPLASAKRVDDPGVAVYFTLNGRQTCFACDRWDKVEDNIWAIAKTIEAMRGIARWGTGDMMEAAFAGFAALPPPGNGVDWRRELADGIGPISTLERAESLYRRKARTHHPDAPGGSNESMARLNAAIEAARKELG